MAASTRIPPHSVFRNRSPEKLPIIFLHRLCKDAPRLNFNSQSRPPEIVTRGFRFHAARENVATIGNLIEKPGVLFRVLYGNPQMRGSLNQFPTLCLCSTDATLSSLQAQGGGASQATARARASEAAAAELTACLL